MEDKRKWLHFTGDEEARKILMTWWSGLSDRRGDRADLRRTASPDEALFVPAYHHLRGSLLSAGYSVNADALGAVVGLAARVKDNVQCPFAKQMSVPPGKDRPMVSELRFRRLLETKTQKELYPLLGRVLSLLSGTADLLDLAESIYCWNDSTRKRWAMDYYGSLPMKSKK